MATNMIPPDTAPAFLADAGWGGAQIVPLAGDASFRRYFRVLNGDYSAVLMDAPPEKGEDVRPFVQLAEYLVSIGLSAPAILHRDVDRGLLLIEDFGGNRMREAVDADGASEPAIYQGVVDVLVELHRHSPPQLKPHGLAAWLDEVDLFPNWYGPAVGLDVDASSFRSAWEEVLAPIDQDGIARVTELRDFHAENIMLIDGRTGVARYGLLDFQDALVGHPAYDLVSMLEDARRDVSPAVELAMLRRYMEATRRDPAFERAYWALGAQRNTRILGVFCRLWKRDGKPHYTGFQPRMWGLLERNLTAPGLEPLRQWFDANVPQDKRAPFWIGRQL